MTKREMFVSILNGDINDEVKAMVEAEITHMDEANAKAAEKRAAKAAEDAPLYEAALANAGDGITASALGEILEVSTQKASYILRALVAQGKMTAEDTKIDKRACKLYHLVQFGTNPRKDTPFGVYFFMLRISRIFQLVKC